MKILNFGSLNLDYVYSVDHIVAPGETISSNRLEIYCGGKGLNQSIALAKAGAQVFHAGSVGADGEILREILRENKVDTTYIRIVSERSGNAIIQVDTQGQNSIVLFGGANQQNDRQYVDHILRQFAPGDWILLQNEINHVDYIIDKAAEMGIMIALNPSPYCNGIASWNLQKVNLFFLNEVEGAQLTGKEHVDDIFDSFHSRFPTGRLALTLGKDGAVYYDGVRMYRHGIYKVNVVDTTAAGDTFTGYFLHNIITGKSAEEALRLASVASSLAVSRKGASTAIPFSHEVEAAQLQLQ